MGLYFTFDEEDTLSWTIEGAHKPTLTEAQAAIIASAETASALRAIAAAIYQVSEEIRDTGHKLAKDTYFLGLGFKRWMRKSR